LISKGIELRKQKAMKGRRKPLSEGEIEKIETESNRWAENGTKATTNRSLAVLRAIFNFLVKRGTISKSDVPESRWPRMLTTIAGDIRASDLPKLLKEISPRLHPFVKFLYATGLRSGPAKDLTRNKVDKNCAELHEPGELTQDGEPIFDLVQGIKNMLRLNGQPIFDTTNFRKQWRGACHRLGLGVFNPETEAYRGLRPHDFRRIDCQNMVKHGIPQTVARVISGHKTDSMFRRYAIMDKSAVQDAFEVLASK
jgi:integrase